MVFVAVGEEVFEERGGLPVFGIVALEAVDERDGHGSVEEGIFAVDFFAAAPTRIAGKVGLRTPEHENLALVFWRLGDVASFVALDAGGLTNEIWIPCFAHTGGLGKLGGGDGEALAAWLALDYAVNALG